MNRIKIWHDPQHGGSNKGSEYFGLVERVWTVEMVSKIMDCLCGFDCDHESARKTDETIQYSDRAEAAKLWGADIAFLHHVNAMVYPEGNELEGQPWPKFDGLMTFYLPQDYIGRDIAVTMGLRAPPELIQKKPSYAANKYDWTENAYNCLINYARLSIPAVLIEWGFSTSPVDRSFLMSETRKYSLCSTMSFGYSRAIELIGDKKNGDQNKDNEPI